jgi:hypothetical protein
MATRGRTIALTTSYQNAFDSGTDEGPAVFVSVYASGNDVTIQVTYLSGRTDETVVASGQSIVAVRDFTGGGYPELITNVKVKGTSSSGGNAFVAAGPRA